MPQVTKGKGKTAVRQREGAIRIWLALTQLIITFLSYTISSLVRARGRIIILWNASIDLLASTHHMSLFWLMKFEIEKSTTKNFIPRLRFYLSVKWLVFSPSSSFSSFQIKFVVHRRASRASIEFMFSRLAVVWPDCSPKVRRAKLECMRGSDPKFAFWIRKAPKLKRPYGGKFPEGLLHKIIRGKLLMFFPLFHAPFTSIVQTTNIDPL